MQRPRDATLIRTKPQSNKNRVLGALKARKGAEGPKETCPPDARAVTGGGGFLGSHLVDYLVERGDHVRASRPLRRARGGRARGTSSPPGRPALTPPSQVVVVDNFFTGSHHNIAHHLGKPNFELIRHDVVQPILIEARA